jgi:putative ABC transport system permease protein
MLFEIRLAWRETRPAWKRFLILVFAVALGVGALTGLKGFSRALERSIHKSARDLIASDLVARMNVPIQPGELKVLESPVSRGAVLTRTTETLSMVSGSDDSAPILSDIRAVDPGYYPFYGKVELDPPILLKEALSGDGTVVSRDLLVRTGLVVGDNVQIGAARFRINAVLKSEPDRISFGIDIGPRILISREGLDRSELIQFGSRATESFLYKLPAKGLDPDEAREMLLSGIERRVRITDYRNPNPRLSRGLERTANFLSLLGLLALLVGGLGISTTMYTYLQQKLDSIAVLKCLGGRSGQILRIYMIQGLVLGVLGSVIGIGFGYMVQLLLPQLLKGLVDLPADLELAPGAAFQGLTIGVLTTMMFLLPPLLAIRKIHPIRLFLREMPETRHSTLKRLRRDPVPLVVSLVLFFGTGLAASWLAESLRWGFTFLAGLIACIVVLIPFSLLLLWLLRRLPRLSLLVLRQGLKNLNRPGNHAVSVMVALGLGVAFVLTVYFIQTSLISQIVQSAPADFPNVFMLGITEQDEPKLAEFLKEYGGLREPTLIPSISSQLLTIDGHAPPDRWRRDRDRDREQEPDPEDQRRRPREFTLTWADALPPDTVIVKGEWWKPPFTESLVSVEEYAAERYGIKIGSVLKFDISGRIVRGKVSSIRSTEFPQPGGSNQFIFSPGALAGSPTSYIGTVRMASSDVGAFQGALFKRFPNVTSIDVGDVLARVQDLLDKISIVVRFVALFAIASGLIILASSVTSTRYQRIRETVLFRTLGATRSQLRWIQTVELLTMGSAAGLVGGILAAIAAHFLLGELLETEFDFQWLPLLIGIVASAILTAGTGWLAGRGILKHKPLTVLREN